MSTYHDPAHASETFSAVDPAAAQELARIAAEAGFHVDDLTSGFADIAHTMINEELDVWGFAVLKTWGYNGGQQAQAFAQFWQRWSAFMDEQLRANGARGDLRTGLAGKLQWLLIEDERLDGADVARVREVFTMLAEDEERYPNGLDIDMCLVVDEESVRSLLDPQEGSVPFVTGVAREIDEDENNRGYFRIAMDTLIPDVWYLLSVMSPGQIDPGDGSMYRGILTGQDLDDMDMDMNTDDEHDL